MLSNKVAKMPLILRGFQLHTPASSVALSRIFLLQNRGYFERIGKSQIHFLTAKASKPPVPIGSKSNLFSQQQHKWPNSTAICPRWLSTEPIYHNDHDFAKDLSTKEYDKVYLELYEQHNHRHGPWLKILQSAQHVLKGQKNVRILDIESGPGGPASILASNFPDADIISAHSTAKCVSWASNRLHEKNTSNVSTRLVPDMQNLDVFGDASFDLVTCCYGLSGCKDPEAAVQEMHRVLKPGGTLLVSLLENSSADIAGDIILKSAGSPALRHKEENIASKAHHHFLENMIEKTNLSILHVTNDEYPIKLGNSKEFAFKALTIPIRSELQELNKRGEYHSTDAENAFDDILNEGFMAKQGPNGEMEIPYNVYKFVAARRQFEDGDTARDLWPKHINHGNSMKRARPLTPYDARHDPVVFDTWVRMKPAASEKITKAVNKQINMYNDSTKVKVLDTAPSPYAETAISIATTHPDAQVIATSKSLNIVEGIRGIIADHGLSNMQVNALDESHLSKFGDKSFDIVISSFGLTFLNSPKQALDEFHRVLKPGGSLIISVWEDFSLRQLSEYIVNEMRATGSLEDFAVFDVSPSNVLGQLTPYAEPHALENLIHESGFDLTRVDHETAKIFLLGANCTENVGMNVATLAIRPFLEELKKTGENKDADVKNAFESLLKDPSLVSRDACGNAITTLPSRFKLVCATRPFSDADGYINNDSDIMTKKASRKVFKVKDIPN